MRKFLLLLLLLTSMISLRAIIEWNINGAPVHQSSNAIFENSSVITSDGNLVTFWSDTRNGFRELYAQKLDADGNKFWAEDGMLIGSHPSLVHNVVAVANNQNEVIVAYLNSTPGLTNNQMYLQKISATGEKFWGDTGRLIDGSYTISQPKLIMHTDGSTTATWIDHLHNKVKAVRLNFNGTVVSGWGADFQQTTQIGIDIIDVTRDYALTDTSADGIMLASNLGSDIYFQKMNLTGEKLFGSLGSLALTETAEIQAIDLQKAADNYYLTWRLNSASEKGLHLLKFDTEANWQWEEEVVISELSRYFQLAIDSSYQPIIAWYKYENNQRNLYAQKFSSAGEEIWDANGILLGQNLANGKSFDLNAHNETCFISYLIDNNDATFLRKLQKISAGGELLFGDEAVTIISYDWEQFPQNFGFVIGQQDLFLCWNELVDGESKIKLQTTDLAGNLQIDEEDQTVFGALYGSVTDYQLLASEDLPLFSWLDNRNGSHQVFIQKLSETGSPLFAENGIAMTSNSGTSLYPDYDISYNPVNNLTATAWSIGNVENRLRSSAIDLSGNLLWEDLIIYSNDAHNAPRPPMINAWGEDFLVAFPIMEEWSYNQLVIQKISEGELAWGANGIIIAEMDDFELNIVDVYEDIIFFENDGFLEWNIFAQRITSAGEIYPNWPENGLNISSNQNSDYLGNYQISPTPLGTLVSWDNVHRSEIQIQIVQPHGELYWDEPLSFPYGADFVNYQITYNEGIYLTKTYRQSYTDSSVIIQKLSLSGEALWAEPTEIVISNSLRDIKQINLADNIVLIWEEEDSDNKSYVKFQEITPAGDFIYATNGVNLFGNSGFSSSPQIIFTGEFAYASCIDSRSFTLLDEYGLGAAQNLYAQKLSLETLIADNQLNLPQNNLKNYPNPFYLAPSGRTQNTTISYNLPQAVETAQIIIYNLKGQKINQLKAAKRAGENKIFWNGKDANQQPVASGIYLYKLVADDKTLATERMIIIK